MTNLLRDNKCLSCNYYDSDANDYYHEWCNHPTLEEETDKYISDECQGDYYNWVKICPLTGKSPYIEEGGNNGS